jgi:hypothetical protein
VWKREDNVRVRSRKKFRGLGENLPILKCDNGRRGRSERTARSASGRMLSRNWTKVAVGMRI